MFKLFAYRMMIYSITAFSSRKKEIMFCHSGMHRSIYKFNLKRGIFKYLKHFLFYLVLPRRNDLISLSFSSLTSALFRKKKHVRDALQSNLIHNAFTKQKQPLRAINVLTKTPDLLVI